MVQVMELEHIGHTISLKLQKRASHRGNRRSRLRFRQPRFNNRRKPQGCLPPSIRHNLDQMLSWTRALTQLYPVASIRISTAKFDTQLMENPDIQGEEYQRGTLYGWQLRAYVFHRNGHRCCYCGEQGNRLTLDHVIPKSRGGTDRVVNLTAACLKCNQLKDNQLPEEFLADRPDKLRQLLDQSPRRSYRDATWLNTIMPQLVEALAGLEMPVEQTNTATTGWNRKQMQLAKTHCMDAAILGTASQYRGCLSSQPTSGPATGDASRRPRWTRTGPPAGDPFKKYCRLSPREQSRTPTPGHAGKRTHFGPDLIATGDIATIQHRKLGAITAGPLSPTGAGA